jgi:hypothetical protein
MEIPVTMERAARITAAAALRLTAQACATPARFGSDQVVYRVTRAVRGQRVTLNTKYDASKWQQPGDEFRSTINGQRAVEAGSGGQELAELKLWPAC